MAAVSDSDDESMADNEFDEFEVFDEDKFISRNFSRFLNHPNPNPIPTTIPIVSSTILMTPPIHPMTILAQSWLKITVDELQRLGNPVVEPQSDTDSMPGPTKFSMFGIC